MESDFDISYERKIAGNNKILIMFEHKGSHNSLILEMSCKECQADMDDILTVQYATRPCAKIVSTKTIPCVFVTMNRIVPIVRQRQNIFVTDVTALCVTNVYLIVG